MYKDSTAEPCPACAGDGRIPDKTGGGHHGTCPECHGTGITPAPQSVVDECLEPFGRRRTE